MLTAEVIKNANDGLAKTDVGHGKKYVMVTERIKAFREICPNGAIDTAILSMENGIVTIQAKIYDENDHLLASGLAQEKEKSSFINKTSYVENCVPLTTKILTAEGWKYYYQLKPGEDVLSLNMETGVMEFCKLTAVNVHKDRPLVRLQTSRFKVVCTPQHKWVAKTQNMKLTKIPTQELTNSWKIVQGVKQDIVPSAQGKRLGWLMCDCDMDMVNGMASTAYISQSKYIDEVTELFGDGRKCKKYKETWKDNYEWIIPADKVRQILGSFGMATYKDLPRAMAKASIEDVAGCYSSMMLADGESRGFSSTYTELIDAMQIMCARLGIATTFVSSRMMKNSTKPIYTLGIKATDGAWFSEMEVTNMPPQDVWCPTTENGTWVMNQDGFVTLTSNCETSAVGRALGMLGIGVDESMASAEEVANAIKNQNDGASEPASTSDSKESTIDECKVLRQKIIAYGKEHGMSPQEIAKDYHISNTSTLSELQSAYDDLTKEEPTAEKFEEIEEDVPWK